MFRLIRIAIKDVYRSPFKTIIFSLIICTGISALILAFSMNMSINNNVNSSIVNTLSMRKIYIGVSDSKEKTEKQLMSYLNTIPHIQYVNKYITSVIANIDGDSILSKGGYILKSDPTRYLPKVVKGRSFNDADKNMAIIPEKLFVTTDSYGSSEIINSSKLIGKTISLVYSGKDGKSKYKYDCKVIGIYANQLDNTSNEIYIPLNDMYEVCTNIGLYASTEALLFTAIIDQQQFVDITVKKLSSMNGITAGLYDTSNNSNVGPYKLLMKISNFMVYSIILFITLMLYICVTNIAMSNKKYIALYKAIGYNNYHIFIMAFIESTFISLIGYFLGILAAILSSNIIINPLIFTRTKLILAISISPLSCIIPLALIVPITFIVSLFVYLKTKNIYPAILLNED